jgi:hypothetical protein
MALYLCIVLVWPCTGPACDTLPVALLLYCACQAKALRWKLTTRRADGADGGFAEKHSDLPPEELQDKEQHLVKQVRDAAGHSLLAQLTPPPPTPPCIVCFENCVLAAV